ncbi:hypothetical protein QBC47DRAFT_440258 [Echria macrotheca]|uniref:Infection structure specific protein n=1 Tax=Echria macrotheca TaxID=438768 RepID=A0AAJ0F3P7_9PEZI|nr:hypothetical protein QBC47DRAFT_440258 [Echria macrotheca]
MRTPTLTLLPLIGITTVTVTASTHPHLNQPRQTGSPAASSCLASVESIASSFPVIPQDLIGLTDIKPITDACNYTPPATMASDFSSFSSAVNSWVQENWPKVTSVVAKCPEIQSDVDGFEKAWDFLICSTGTGGGSAASTTTGGGTSGETTPAAPTGTVVNTIGTETTGTAGSGAQSTTKSAAGVRETRLVNLKGVVAVVGAVGAVVAL